MIQMPLSLSVMGWLPPDSSLSPPNPSSTCTQEVSERTCAASHCFPGLGVSPPEGLIWSRRRSLLLWAVFCTPPPSSRCAVHSDPFTATGVSWSLQGPSSPGAFGLASPLPIASCDFPGNRPSPAPSDVLLVFVSKGCSDLFSDRRVAGSHSGQQGCASSSSGDSLSPCLCGSLRPPACLPGGPVPKFKASRGAPPPPPLSAAFLLHWWGSW